MLRQKKFTRNEIHSVSVAEVIDFINNYRLHSGPGAKPGGFFDKRAIQTILQQPNAVGMRYYYGLKDNGLPVLVLVATNADRNDLIDGEPVKVSILNPPVSAQGTYDFAHVSHDISLEEAARLTTNYRKRKDHRQPIDGFFGKMAVQNILKQPECVGIRFYFGLNKDAIHVLVMMGVNQFCSEMFSGRLIEISASCPPLCGALNLLKRGFHSKTEYKMQGKYADKNYYEAIIA